MSILQQNRKTEFENILSTFTEREKGRVKKNR